MTDQSPAPIASTKPARLRTKYVFVDTSIHLAAKFSYRTGQFARLAQLAADGLASVLDTEIDVGEIHSHISIQAKEAVEVLRKFQREAPILSTSPHPDISALMRPTDHAAIESQFMTAFREYRVKANVISAPLHGLSILAVFRDYFAKAAPFGADKKKSEFPDAFILAALTNWCEVHDLTLYLVSLDSGMREAAAGTSVLFPLERLDEFLDRVVSEKHRPVAVALQQWLVAKRGEVIDRIRTEFGQAGFMLEEYDGDVEDVVAEEVKAAEPLLVEIREDGAVAEVPCEFTFSADISYEDPNTGIYDSEDKVMVFMDTRRARIKATAAVSAEVRLGFERGEGEGLLDKDTINIEDVIIAGGDDIRVSAYSEVLVEYPDDEDEDDYYHWHE